MKPHAIRPGLRAKLWAEIALPVLHTYSVVFFSQSARLGAALLAATLLAPQFGLMGLAGVLIGLAAARLLGFDRALIRPGLCLYNSLLVSLALAYLFNYQKLPPGTLVLLLATSSILTLFLSVMASDLLYRHHGLPAMSLPFVGITLLLFFLFFSFTGTPITSTPPRFLLPAPALPSALGGFFEAFGAIFFLPHAGVGLVVFAALLAWSRLAVVYGSLGYLVGVLALAGLGVDHTPAALAYVGFNFVFTGIALGGIFFIPGRGSLLLVALGAFFCAVLAVAVKTFLRYFGIPPLALPLNLAVLIVLYAMRLRAEVRHLQLTPFVPASPEYNFRRFFTGIRRFPDALLPHLRLPFFGERTVTQGFDGPRTHKGDWRHAFDFEILDERARRAEPDAAKAEEQYTFNTPVVAPGHGIVVKVVAHVADNPLGATNLDQNWGNLVLIRLDTGGHVLLCHLKKDSVAVKENDRVAPGTAIGACGNSGRSPFPHLHLHVQATDQVGAGTIPFRLSHYLEHDGAGWRYRSSGVPAADRRLRPVEFSDPLAACFDRLGETRLTFRTRGDGARPEGHDELPPEGGTRTGARSEFRLQPEALRGASAPWPEAASAVEHVQCTIDETGAHILRSDAGGRLTARISEHVFYAMEYEGAPDSALYFLWLGLSRLPMTLENGLAWNDALDSRLLLRPGVRLWSDFWGPFGRYPLVGVESRLLAAGDAFLGRPVLASVRSRLDVRLPESFLVADRPREIRIFFARQGGLIGLEVHRASGVRTIECVEE